MFERLRTNSGEEGSIKQSISNMLPNQLAELMQSLGQPAWRGKTVFGWLHKKHVQSFDEMTDLPLALRRQLSEKCRIDTVTAVNKQTSKDGTVKMLAELWDGNCVETVVMQYRHGTSVCVSTQAGCRMGCRFCASSMKGGPGFIRGLSPSEIAGQIYLAEKEAGSRVSNVVLMGIGEPLDNFDNVIEFIGLISSEDGYGLSKRSITLSTCGLVPEIYSLAETGLPITLSVSLHASNNDARSRLMPINNKYPIEELLKACRFYQEKTGRRVSYEYALVSGQNDSEKDAKELAGILAGLCGHVNLIGVNAVQGAGFTPADRQRLEDFKNSLERLGQKATIRRRLGTDIDAACGQLRNKKG